MRPKNVWLPILLVIGMVLAGCTAAVPVAPAGEA